VRKQEGPEQGGKGMCAMTKKTPPEGQLQKGGGKDSAAGKKKKTLRRGSAAFLAASVLCPRLPLLKRFS